MINSQIFLLSGMTGTPGYMVVLSNDKTNCLKCFQKLWQYHYIPLSLKNRLQTNHDCKGLFHNCAKWAKICDTKPVEHRCFNWNLWNASSAIYFYNSPCVNYWVKRRKNSMNIFNPRQKSQPPFYGVEFSCNKAVSLLRLNAINGINMWKRTKWNSVEMSACELHVTRLLV